MHRENPHNKSTVLRHFCHQLKTSTFSTQQTRSLDRQTAHRGGAKEILGNWRWIAHSQVDQFAGRTAHTATGPRVTRNGAAQALRRLSLCESVDGAHIATDRGGPAGARGDLFAVSAVQLFDVRLEFQFYLHALQGQVSGTSGRFRTLTDK